MTLVFPRETCRIAVVGAGVMGRHHARVLSTLEGAAVTHVSDAREEAALALANDVGAVATTTREALARADAVVIATPMDTHAALVRDSLLLGKHVLVEKPLSTSVERARELVRLADERGVVLAVGHSERFNPAVIALFLATSDDPILRLETTRMATSGARSPFASVLYNLAVHDLDLAEHLSRAPVSLLSARGHDDWARLETGAASFVASHEISRRASAKKRVLFATTASGAHYEADLLSGTLCRDGAPVSAPHAEPLSSQAREWLAAISGTREGLAIATAEQAARAVELAAAAESWIEPRARGQISP